MKFIVEEKEDYLKAVQKEDDYFLSLIKPKNLNGNDTENIIYQSRKQFENLCVVLINQGMADPEKMTVFRFYTTIKFFETKKQNNERLQNKRTAK